MSKIWDRYPRVEPVVLQVAFCDRTAPYGADLLEKSFSFPSKDLSLIFVAFLRNKTRLRLNSSTGRTRGLLRFASDKTIDYFCKKLTISFIFIIFKRSCGLLQFLISVSFKLGISFFINSMPSKENFELSKSLFANR